MSDHYLYEKLDILREASDKFELPDIILNGLSTKISLRSYQEAAFNNFINYYENDNLRKNKQIHTLFHMATGSGKTVIMAGLILYLYTKGYRNFLFFVNQTNVLEKTIENFINPLSTKYLFNDVVKLLGNEIKIKKVSNFADNKLDNNINLVFTTTQKLHMDLFEAKENSLTLEDFENNKVVFISDESHHVNSMTKKPTSDEKEAAKSWEYSVVNAFLSNKDNILLEFTATCDLKDKNVQAKYLDKIVFNYPLISFRESGYTKDFQNFATDSDLWTRALMAIVMSEYRKFLFADLGLNIKPVVMFKSQKISESEDFYNEFFHKINELSISELTDLEFSGIEALTEAIKYFKEKDDTLELLINSLKNSFNTNTAIIMNGASDNNKDNQILVNSLEDLSNPIRLIFAVDMLNEGWDVLNLFDIVRLYDTRQTNSKSSKISSYTIKEAQLIGRGARYCPFSDGNNEYKFKRKYDGDLSNKNRILETMFYHSKNDSRYISELKQALIETGLQSSDPIVLEYNLKDNFKSSDFYKKAYVFSNKKVLNDKSDRNNIESSLKNKVYRYTVSSGKGIVNSLFEEDDNMIEGSLLNTTTIKFKDIDLNIILGAMDCFEELRFDILKQKYPTIKTKKDFLVSDEFLGNSLLEITHLNHRLSGKDIFKALKNALGHISSYVISLKPKFFGSREFTPRLLRDVLKDKKIYIDKIDQSGGKGASQNNCVNEEYRLNLEDEDWYVFNDNYGTSEEKRFLKYFKNIIEPKLIGKSLEYYLIRNERIPELAIYSFDSGERFEPDFLLLVKKVEKTNSQIYQGYIEPKGSHLLYEDSWKEEFSLQIEENHQVKGLVVDNYKILGFPFFNSESRVEMFEKAVEDFINKLN